MERLKRFNEFINEAEFKLDNPTDAGSKLANVLAQNSIGGVEVGTNSGPFVNKMQQSVGITDGQPWCMAFIFYIFDQFSKKMGIVNPVYKTGSVLDEWAKTGGKKITADQARSDFSLVRPGQIMIATRKGGGHGGIVTSVDYNGKKFTTIEGNVGIGGGKQGVGPYNRSVLTEGLIGFIDYFPNRTPEFDKSFSNAIKGKLHDVSGNDVVRELPDDSVVGGKQATGTDDKKEDSGNAGGFLGNIIKGAKALLHGGETSSEEDVSDADAVKALTSMFSKK